MPTKTTELELSNRFSFLPLEEGYDRYRILIRSGLQPVGWISLPTNRQNSFSYNEVQAMIKDQIGQALIQQALADSFSNPKKTNTYQPISIIICTRNRTAQLEICLKAISSLQYPSYEVIVVDNAPTTDDTFRLVSGLPFGYVREEKPGLDRARNRGIAEASHNIVAFTDDDVRVDAGWLQAINQVFSNPEVMGTSGYVAAAELQTSAQHIFELNYGGMGHGFRRRYLKKEALNEKQLLWASNFGIGANMAFRKQIFQKIGGFDTALDVGTPSHGGGDVEMFHRLVIKGYLFVYEPSLLVWHFHRREYNGLRKQIFDNGRSFGCYLIDCFRKRTVSRFSIIEFLLVEWFYNWNLKNVIARHGKVPRPLALMELYGMFTSPFAYFKTKRWNRKMNRQ